PRESRQRRPHFPPYPGRRLARRRGGRTGMTTRQHVQSLTVTVEQAAAALGISRGLAYELVRRGEIPSVRLGRRIVVPIRVLDELIGGTPADQPKPPAA